MTTYELQKANELTAEMEKIRTNILILHNALTKKSYNGKIKRFFCKLHGKEKISIAGDEICFGGFIEVDRDCLEMLKTYFENKLFNKSAEFERIGDEK